MPFQSENVHNLYSVVWEACVRTPNMFKSGKVKKKKNHAAFHFKFFITKYNCQVVKKYSILFLCRIYLYAIFHWCMYYKNQYVILFWIFGFFLHSLHRQISEKTKVYFKTIMPNFSFLSKLFPFILSTKI